jgi:hypothetical protein
MPFDFSPPSPGGVAFQSFDVHNFSNAVTRRLSMVNLQFSIYIFQFLPPASSCTPFTIVSSTAALHTVGSP